MKLSTQERRDFAASFLPAKTLLTVATFCKMLNHEMWRTCNSCGDCFDVKKELKMICPSCGSSDLKI